MKMILTSKMFVCFEILQPGKFLLFDSRLGKIIQEHRGGSKEETTEI